jgi:hypothetical protein
MSGHNDHLYNCPMLYQRAPLQPAIKRNSNATLKGKKKIRVFRMQDIHLPGSESHSLVMIYIKDEPNQQEFYKLDKISNIVH